MNRLRQKVLLGAIGLLLFHGAQAEAFQTYNIIVITNLEATPNPFAPPLESTTIRIGTFEYAEWFWLSPKTMVRPTILVWVAGRPLFPTMTSESMGQLGFFCYWWALCWYNQIGQWTHEAVWDGKNLQGTVVPPGPYLATVNVYAGGTSTVGYLVLNVASQKRITLTLTPSEVLPGKRTEVQVEARDGQNNPIPNYAVTLEAFAPQYIADPCNDCGGHSHDTNRPVGEFISMQGDRLGSATQGTTGPNGEPWVLKYEASGFGGVETLVAKGTQEPGIKDEKRPIVEVPGFSELGEGDGYTLIGMTSTHPGNHFGTSNTLSSLMDIAYTYAYEELKGTLRVNDISLPSGGAFDICAKWDVRAPCLRAPKGGHREHRFGNNVDVSNETAEKKVVTKKSLVKVIDDLDINVTVRDEGNHFHLTFR